MAICFEENWFQAASVKKSKMACPFVAKKMYFTNPNESKILYVLMILNIKVLRNIV